MGLWIATVSPALSASPEPLAKSNSWAVGVAPVYAYLVLAQELQPDGGGLELFVSYQLSASFSIRLAGLWTAHHLQSTDQLVGGTLQVIAVGGSLAYAVDLGRWRPQLEFGLEVLHRRLVKTTPTDAGIKAGLAIDYPLYPWLLVGGAAYYHAFLTSPSQIPVYVEIGPRIAFCW